MPPHIARCCNKEYAFVNAERESMDQDTRTSDAHKGGGFDLPTALGRVAHWLPRQGPIKDFVHHNTLHAFEYLPFHEGVAAGARVYGARAAMPQAFYLEAYRNGRIRDAALERALAATFADDAERALAKQTLLSGAVCEPAFAGLARGGVREAWSARLGGVPLHRRSHLHIFRLVGGYLDQGLSIWRMPGSNRLGFWECVQALVRESALPVYPFDTPGARALMPLPAGEALVGALARTVKHESLYERYLLETLLAIPGWSGLIAECERNPTLLLSPRPVSLLDFSAVVLVAEVGCLEHELGADFSPLDVAPTPDLLADPGTRPKRGEAEVLLAVWQDAFEWSYYEELLGALQANARRTARRRADDARVFAFFCIDDRLCSVRRHLEELSPSVATFGTAGFFGLDFMYRGADDAIASKQCPAPMIPRHLILEERPPDADAAAPADRAPWWKRLLHLEAPSNTFFRGWFLSYALGPGAAARLAASVFRPSLAPVMVPPLSTVSSDAHFRLIRQGNERSAEGLLLGFSPQELADRIAFVLRSCGAVDAWPELVVLFGHGASSVNNPYFAAYNCGACSGRTGAPNARAFAKAANRPEVRAALRARGLDIPEGTWFVGALMDTTRDDVTWYDLDRLPARLRARMDEFERTMKTALERNAAERCRRFESVPLPVAPEQALEVVRERAFSLFEPRPEYNHATNASCVIGRRALTAGLFLDRRTFLSSYDLTRDPDGDLLVQVLAAVVPVCAGINLEYFFSRLDPRVYGAGSKLPHNVNGLFGVCNGVENDLLTGLPTQMTEIHDPVRLLVVVEHAPDVAFAAAARTPSVAALVENAWVRYACLDPTTGRVWLANGGRMVETTGLSPPAWRWPTSLDAARQSRDNLPIGFIGLDESLARSS